MSSQQCVPTAGFAPTSSISNDTCRVSTTLCYVLWDTQFDPLSLSFVSDPHFCAKFLLSWTGIHMSKYQLTLVLG